MPRPPGLSKDDNPGNARWCETHNRLECTKRKGKRPGPCHALAIRGLDACSTHCGHRRDVAVAKGQANITAWSAIGKPRGGQTIDAGLAVLGMLQMTWLRAAAYGELLRQQVTTEERADPNRDGLQGGELVQRDGLIGYRYGAAGKDGTIYAVSEEARALVALEAAERDRVVKYAKTAHDMGISERLTNLAETWGSQVIRQVIVILEQLNLSPEQEGRVPDLIQAHLGAIEMGGTET
jgi:hypothetical protein